MGFFAKLEAVLALCILSVHITAAFNTTLYERNTAICETYLVQGEDSCASIAKAHSITTAQIGDYNNKNYAWHGCNKIRQGDFICVGSGEPPMPAALPNAVCGPQVPGTVRPIDPIDWDNLGSMNPCPSGQCCTVEGQCSKSGGSCGGEAGPAVAQTTTKSTTTKKEESKTAEPETTKTTTSKTDPEETGALWSVAFYSQEECTGDYYVVQGHTAHSSDSDKCIGLHSGISSIDRGTNTWCRWYTNGGFDSTDCDSSGELEIKSWHIHSGICTVYDTETCESNGVAQAYWEESPRKCKNADKWAPKVLGGLKCAHEQ